MSDDPNDELMSPEEMQRLIDAEGMLHTAWEIYGRWLKRWRKLHPDDDRREDELVDVFCEEVKVDEP